MPPAPPRSPSFLARVDPAILRLLAGVIAIAILGWTGLRVMRRGAETRASLRTAESTLTSFADLRRRYTPAVAAESIAWRRTWLQLQSLGVAGDERLAMTQQVAQAAEAAGMRDVRVLIGGADTTDAEARLSTGDVERKVASFSLSVEGRGGMASVIGFLGRLPPSVSATQLSMARQAGETRHRISLAVYELTFENGPPPLWSSTERGGAGDGGRRRPGG
jgi:hypothetical protein